MLYLALKNIWVCCQEPGGAELISALRVALQLRVYPFEGKRKINMLCSVLIMCLYINQHM